MLKKTIFRKLNQSEELIDYEATDYIYDNKSRLIKEIISASTGETLSTCCHTYSKDRLIKSELFVDGEIFLTEKISYSLDNIKLKKETFDADNQLTESIEYYDQKQINKIYFDGELASLTEVFLNENGDYLKLIYDNELIELYEYENDQVMQTVLFEGKELKLKEQYLYDDHKNDIKWISEDYETGVVDITERRFNSDNKLIYQKTSYLEGGEIYESIMEYNEQGEISKKSEIHIETNEIMITEYLY